MLPVVVASLEFSSTRLQGLSTYGIAVNGRRIQGLASVYNSYNGESMICLRFNYLLCTEVLLNSSKVIHIGF